MCPWYVEDPEQPIQLESETKPITKETWQQGLEEFANTPRDNYCSLTYWKLVSDDSGENHQLFVVVNHGGIDGIGIFTAMHTFLKFLGQVIAGAEILPPVSLEFL